MHPLLFIRSEVAQEIFTLDADFHIRMVALGLRSDFDVRGVGGRFGNWTPFLAQTFKMEFNRFLDVSFNFLFGVAN